jgi:hypothetical protein
MTFLPTIVDELEAFLRLRADELTLPYESECLCCFVARQLDEFGCTGSHRHAVRYRDVMAPRATALVERLRRVGACCCDCELFLNGYELRGVGEVLPPCGGVRRGSVRPCAAWVRIGVPR